MSKSAPWRPELGRFLLLSSLIAAAGSVEAANPTLHPNSQKYRDAKPSVSGRAGTATLYGRMLIGRLGSTLVQVGTGPFDTGTPGPGFITRVQVKAYDGDGNLVFTDTFKGNESGSSDFSTGYGNLHRGQPLHLQANVRAIDGPRTEVVTVTDVVRALPDLAPMLHEMPFAIADTPTVIAATVSELNGDTGGRADCVLYVDGVRVDQMAGIWVDAGDTVSCAFTHRFTERGTHGIRVSLENAVLEDWDTENDSASGTVEVKHAGERDFDSAAASVFLYERSVMHRSWGSSSTGSQGSDWQFFVVGSDFRQRHELYANVSAAVSFPASVSVSVSDGNVTSTADLTLDPVLDAASCGPLHAVSQTEGRIVTLWGSTCPEGTYFRVLRDSGAITYLSRQYVTSWYYELGQRREEVSDQYFWSENVVGSEAFSGMAFEMLAELDSANGTYFTTTPLHVVAVPTLREERITPLTCSSSDGAESRYHCLEEDVRSYTWSGFAIYTPPQAQ